MGYEELFYVFFVGEVIVWVMKVWIVGGGCFVG